MLNDNAKSVVAALRSNEYKQGQGSLRNSDEFCCLGVACDVYRKTTGLGEWDSAGAFVTDSGIDESELDEDDDYYNDDNYNTEFLPEEVRQWLGFAHRSGIFNIGTDKENSLWRLNDNATTFAEIADIIESEPPGLFK